MSQDEFKDVLKNVGKSFLFVLIFIMGFTAVVICCSRLPLEYEEQDFKALEK